MIKKFLTLLFFFFSLNVIAQTTYKLHDKVKVKWSGQWWDAEIIEVKNDQYKIHYDNYGSNWDEWVKTDRLQQKTNAGIATAKEKQTSIVASDGKYSVGDKIEAWSAGKWYTASVLKVGSDNYKGYYYVHFTDYNSASNQWLNASSLRKSQANAAATDVSPRDGKYRILSYGNPTNPIYLGYFILKEGSYSYYDAANKLLGSGSYSFDKASGTVKWNSGPFKTNDWSGTFEVTREGKTHNIRLRSGTIGTNSTDSQ